MLFGSLLQYFRRQAGLTQVQLGARSTFSVVYIQKLELGTRCPPPVTVEILTRALSLSFCDAHELRTAADSIRGTAGESLGRMEAQGPRSSAADSTIKALQSAKPIVPFAASLVRIVRVAREPSVILLKSLREGNVDASVPAGRGLLGKVTVSAVAISGEAGRTSRAMEVNVHGHVDSVEEGK